MTWHNLYHYCFGWNWSNHTLLYFISVYTGGIFWRRA